MNDKIIQETLAELSKSKDSRANSPGDSIKGSPPKIVGYGQVGVHAPSSLRSKRGLFNELALKELRFKNLAVK